MAEPLDYCSPATNAQDRSVRPAFVLVPVLLVLGYLVLNVSTPKYSHGNAKGNAALSDMANLRDALNAFHADNGRYPTAAEGLAILAEPRLAGAGRAYVTELRMDPWGHGYVYLPVPANGLPFDLRSSGGADANTTWHGISCPVDGLGR